uniref:Predicted gene, 36368 n=1 Tax=Cricetulus griseus TaxID=10029 RepID=A0A8C2LYN2_CRIGR
MEKLIVFLLVFLATDCFSCKNLHYQKKFVQKKHICSIRVSQLCASNNVTYPNSCVYCFANISPMPFTGKYFPSYFSKSS